MYCGQIDNKRRISDCRVLSVAVMVIFGSLVTGCGEMNKIAEFKQDYQVVWLDELDLSKGTIDWGSIRANKSVEGNALKIAQVEYSRGVGSHADSKLIIKINGGSQRFIAKVGVDDEVGQGRGSVSFTVTGDGRELFCSPIMKAGDKAVDINVDVRGIDRLELFIGSGNSINYDHANWVEGRFEVTGDMPVTFKRPREPAVILTPPSGPGPRINSAKVFGVRPGSPVLYTTAATGKRPMSFAAEGLPEGLSLNQEKGIITGKLLQEGDYQITLIAENQFGRASRVLTLKVGDKICLTPPMGWNSWNCWGAAIDQEKISNSARMMVETGLINHGWQYVNIDDCWMVKPDSDDPVLGGPTRSEDGMVLCNKNFPDMQGLIDYIHELGLKAGIYSSPGRWTCQSFEGSYEHELQDAEQYARWGVDYLKYDWCGYQLIAKDISREELMKPYLLMKSCLDRQNRDIVYSLCQYGTGEVWKWGKEAGGNCWRTTGDITDRWESMSRIGFSQDKCSLYGQPGHWNDPVMLVIGQVGWGPTLRETRLTPNEQYTHISLWCLLNSPLLIGCDLAALDDFTLSLLTNDEVLEVKQDPLGEQAVIVSVW